MIDTQTISISRVKESRISEVDFANIPFGKIYTDHMFMADYRGGEWKNFRIVPYGHIPVSPATPALHYGQSIFEGMKAYRGPGGERRGGPEHPGGGEVGVGRVRPSHRHRLAHRVGEQSLGRKRRRIGDGGRLPPPVPPG